MLNIVTRDKFICLFACLALLVPSLLAQVNATGTLMGTVTDPSGAVVPGADVKAVNQDTGLNRETKTNEAGQYRFDLLPAGTYQVRIVSKGFAEQVFGSVGRRSARPRLSMPSLRPPRRALWSRWRRPAHRWWTSPKPT